MLTAAHVLSLDKISMIYDTFYIRDKDNQVFEIGNIYKFDEVKDIVEFEAPGKKFSKWFKLEDKIEMNTPVVSVGSILGEGIIERSGLLTSQKQNNIDDITWDSLSFSADSSPGNSGGPLLNGKCNVIGVILSRNEAQKLGFALPVYEINKLKDNYATYYAKATYGFELIQDRIMENASFSLDLPLEYKEYRKQLKEYYDDFYVRSMDKLFKENEDNIFPRGKTSKEILMYYPRKSFPEIIYENKDDKKWTVSYTESKRGDLDKNGYVTTGSNGPLIFLYLRKPDDLSLQKLYDDPELFMDLVLEVTNESRQIAGHEIRITSYGKPFRSFTHTDKYGRKWLANYWLSEVADKVVMVFSTPCPMGLVSLFKTTSSSHCLYWEYDYKKIVDFVTMGYYGTFDAWKEFLALESYIPDYFKEMNVSYETDNGICCKKRTSPGFKTFL